MQPGIEVLGSLKERREISEKAIREVLENEHVPLRHGTNASGRPGTECWRDRRHFLKLRRSGLTRERARERAQFQLRRERELDLHHPAKTWFLLAEEDGLAVGNVMPLVTPLAAAESGHRELRDARWLGLWLDLYFRARRDHGLRLDEGLSNYGVTPKEQLIYLDDDLYSWDGFQPLANALGVLLRRVHWLDAADWKDLGIRLGRLLVETADDPHELSAVRECVLELCLPDRRQERMREALISGMGGKRPSPVDFGVRDRPLALVADVHANLPALDAVLAELSREGVGEAVILGDLVGYGPRPGDCLERIRKGGFPVIKGNHDHAVATGHTGKGFSREAAWVVEWTRERLPGKALAWLERLPLFLRHDDMYAVHGAPVDPYFFFAYVYEMTAESNLAAMAERDIRWCFHGHSHMGGVFAQGPGGRTGSREPQQDLSRMHRALICPGSVGQPRDGRAGACYALFDPRTGALSLREVPYDGSSVLEEMRFNGFPARQIARIGSGSAEGRAAAG